MKRALGLFLLGFLAIIQACVETAECDESVGCPGDQVCFEYICRASCDQQECSEGFSCEACIFADDNRIVNRCIGSVGLACLPQGE